MDRIACFQDRLRRYLNAQLVLQDYLDIDSRPSSFSIAVTSAIASSKGSGTIICAHDIPDECGDSLLANAQHLPLVKHIQRRTVFPLFACAQKSHVPGMRRSRVCTSPGSYGMTTKESEPRVCLHSCHTSARSVLQGCSGRKKGILGPRSHTARFLREHGPTIAAELARWLTGWGWQGKQNRGGSLAPRRAWPDVRREGTTCARGTRNPGSSKSPQTEGRRSRSCEAEDEPGLFRKGSWRQRKPSRRG